MSPSVPGFAGSRIDVSTLAFHQLAYDAKEWLERVISDELVTHG